MRSLPAMTHAQLRTLVRESIALAVSADVLLAVRHHSPLHACSRESTMAPHIDV